MAATKVAPISAAPETALLLRVMQQHASTAAPPPLSFFSTIDWPLLQSIAYQHGLLPLLYQRLRSHHPPIAPSAVLERISEQCLAITKRNLSLTGELLGIIDLFAAHGIRALPFKGPALSAALYGNPCLRCFTDLDLLLPKEDLPAAQTLLQRRGYQTLNHLGQKHEQAWVQSSGVQSLTFTPRDYVVELHWRLAPRQLGFDVGFEYIWERRLPVDLLGRTVYTFSDEVLLVFLCAHGGKHLWERMEWIYGIAELIRQRPSLNWHDVTSLSTKTGYRRAVRLGLELVRDTFHIGWPAEIDRQLAEEHAARRLAAALRRNLSGPRQGYRTPFEYIYFYQRLRERFRDKARLLLIVAGPGVPDMKMVPLPFTIFWLYPFIRIVRLSFRYVVLPACRRVVAALSMNGA